MARKRYLGKGAVVVIQVRYRGRVARKRRVEAEQRAAAAAAVRVAAAVKVQAAARGLMARRALRASADAATAVQAWVRRRRVRENLSRRRAAAVEVQAAMRAVLASARVGRMKEEHLALLAPVVVQRAWRGAAARAMPSRRANAAFTVQRYCVERSAFSPQNPHTDEEPARVRVPRLFAIRSGGVDQSEVFPAWAPLAVAEIQPVALEQWAIVSWQACTNAHLARATVRRMALATVAIQACWRGVVRRRVAATRKTSAVPVEAFVRGVVVAARYRKTLAAAVVPQARWLAAVELWRAATVAAAAQEAWQAKLQQEHSHGVALRTAVAAQARGRGAAMTVLQACSRGAAMSSRLITEAETPAEFEEVQEEGSPLTLQARRRGVMKRQELWRAATAAAAAAAQEAWLAKLQQEHSHGVARRTCVAAQARERKVAVRPEGWRVRGKSHQEEQEEKETKEVAEREQADGEDHGKDEEDLAAEGEEAVGEEVAMWGEVTEPAAVDVSGTCNPPCSGRRDDDEEDIFSKFDEYETPMARLYLSWNNIITDDEDGAGGGAELAAIRGRQGGVGDGVGYGGVWADFDWTGDYISTCGGIDDGITCTPRASRDAAAAGVAAPLCRGWFQSPAANIAAGLAGVTWDVRREWYMAVDRIQNPAEAARARRDIVVGQLRSPLYVLELCDFWSRRPMVLRTIPRPSPVSLEMYVSDTDAAGRRFMRDIALEHRELIEERKKIPPEFLGVVNGNWVEEVDCGYLEGNEEKKETQHEEAVDDDDDDDDDDVISHNYVDYDKYFDDGDSPAEEQEEQEDDEEQESEGEEDDDDDDSSDATGSIGGPRGISPARLIDDDSDDGSPGGWRR
eukprot:g11955.t1